MLRIQLDTGMTVYVSTYEFYFKLKDEEVELFYQACKADNLGIYIDDPFSDRKCMVTIQEQDTPEELNWDI